MATPEERRLSKNRERTGRQPALASKTSLTSEASIFKRELSQASIPNAVSSMDENAFPILLLRIICDMYFMYYILLKMINLKSQT